MAGVDVFFILTGFLLAHPLFLAESKRLAATPVPPPAPFSILGFIWQRLSRIYPAYIVFMALFCFVINPGGQKMALDLFRTLLLLFPSVSCFIAHSSLCWLLLVFQNHPDCHS